MKRATIGTLSVAAVLGLATLSLSSPALAEEVAPSPVTPAPTTTSQPTQTPSSSPSAGASTDATPPSTPPTTTPSPSPSPQHHPGHDPIVHKTDYWLTPIESTVDHVLYPQQLITEAEAQACGTFIIQEDHYTGTQKQIDAIDGDGVLASEHEDDSILDSWKVYAQKPCQPADSVVQSDSTTGVDCSTNSLTGTYTVTTTPYVYDEESNTWVLDTAHAVVVTQHDAPIPATEGELAWGGCEKPTDRTSTTTVTAATCTAPGVTVEYDTITEHPIKSDGQSFYYDDVVSHETHEIASTPALDCPAAVVTPAPTTTATAKPVAATTTSDDSLAYTGSDERQTIGGVMLGGVLLALGITVALLRRRARQ